MSTSETPDEETIEELRDIAPTLEKVRDLGLPAADTAEDLLTILDELEAQE